MNAETKYSYVIGEEYIVTEILKLKSENILFKIFTISRIVPIKLISPLS
jgi:hypothetical protein